MYILTLIILIPFIYINDQLYLRLTLNKKIDYQ